MIDGKLIQTHLEDRDGGTWVSGLCPFCWERVAERGAQDTIPVAVTCPNGHRLAVLEAHSAGEEEHKHAVFVR
jgi:hypothetical protein